MQRDRPRATDRRDVLLAVFLTLAAATAAAAAGSPATDSARPRHPAAPAGCPDPDDPAVHYVSREPEACATLRFRCTPGQAPFSNDCGCGCRPAGSPEFGAPPDLDLRAGIEISLVQTFLGLGVGLARWTGNETGVKRATVAAAAPDELVVHWREEIREETDASRRRREAFERDPPRAGVGEPQPTAPEPEYALRSREGRITASGVAASREMTLPALWPEGEHTVSETSLIWLSRPAFRELRSARETAWSLGLLESPLFQPAAAVARLRDGLAALEARLDRSPEERRELDRIEAEADFDTFGLTVDGRQRQVRTIVARNWFAEYVILDDEDNPLVLKVTLNPLSGGALDILSPLGALKAVVGYQVTEIRTGPAS